MGLAPKIIYTCNHIIEETETLYGDILMRRNKNTSFPDTAASNVTIIRVDEVLNIDKTIEFSPGTDYEQKTSNNIIEWLDSNNVPKPDEEYYIRCAYNKNVVKKSDGDVCERCGGNGWYVDIFGVNKTTYTTGSQKLCQDFIKALFTEKQEDGYGSNISEIIGQNIYSEAELSLNVSSCIDDVATQISTSQLEQINNGTTVPLTELLDKIVVEEIVLVRDECTCYVTVRIINKNGDSIPFTFTA